MTSSAFVERHAGNCLDNKFLQFKAEQKEKVMKRGWQVFSIGVLSLFSFGVWESSKLSLIDKLGPGPGFFGFWLSVIGIALSCVLLLEVTRRTDAKWSSLEVLPGKAALWRILSIVALIIFATAAFEPLGYRLTILPFTVIMLSALGIRSPFMLVVMPVAASFGVFHVFYYWLKVPLPIGTFGI